MLQQKGWQIVGEDAFNWALAHPASQDVIIVPKLGDLIALDVLDDIRGKAEIKDREYFDFRDSWQANNAQ